jgi:DNA-binding NarL/FixJ family response regulator
MGKIRVLIADDHAVVREGLHNLLEEQSDMTVVGEAGDGLQVVRKVKTIKPDVALVDIQMPNLNGLESISLIKDAVPETEVVILSMHRKDAYVHQALASGARGYVLKASPTSDVLEAIRAVHRGEYFLSSKVNSKIIGAFLKSRDEKPPLSGYDLLSDREQQVFRLLVEGKSSAEIADILCISPKTVEKHRANTMKKLDIHNMVSMVKYAIKIGIIGPELWEE